MKNDRTIRPVHRPEKDQWNSIVIHPLQAGNGVISARQWDVDVVRLGVFEKNKLVEGWQLTFHRIPYFPYTIGYFPKGPMPTAEMLSELKKVGMKKNAVFISNLNRTFRIEEPFDIIQFPFT